MQLIGEEERERRRSDPIFNKEMQKLDKTKAKSEIGRLKQLMQM